MRMEENKEKIYAPAFKLDTSSNPYSFPEWFLERILKGEVKNLRNGAGCDIINKGRIEFVPEGDYICLIPNIRTGEQELCHLIMAAEGEEAIPVTMEIIEE